MLQNGAKEWLVVDRHMVDIKGLTCNKIGASTTAFLTQENKCYQEIDSYVFLRRTSLHIVIFRCFRVTPKGIYDMAKVSFFSFFFFLH